MARAVLRRDRRVAPTDRAGAVTRTLAFALDGASLNGAFMRSVGGHHLHRPRPSSAPSGGASDQAIVAGLGLWIIAGSAYLTLFWGVAGQTPGMRFFGIRLEPPGRGGIGARRAVRRLIGLVLAIIPLGLGLLGILVGDRRRGFQDRFAETEVAYVPDPVPDWARGEEAAAG